MVGGEVNSRRPVDYYNAIFLRVVATGNDNATRVTSLKLEGTEGIEGLCGDLQDMEATGNGEQEVTQWLVASSDLSETSWTLTGTVTGVKIQGSGEDAVLFDVYTAALPIQDFANLQCQVTSSSAPCRVSSLQSLPASVVGTQTVALTPFVQHVSLK